VDLHVDAGVGLVGDQRLDLRRIDGLTAGVQAADGAIVLHPQEQPPPFGVGQAGHRFHEVGLGEGSVALELQAEGLPLLNQGQELRFRHRSHDSPR